jgi:hypothetical protein
MKCGCERAGSSKRPTAMPVGKRKLSAIFRLSPFHAGEISLKRRLNAPFGAE